MTKKIIFLGGGTGGHILPAINLMDHFFSKNYDVVLVTDYRGRNFLKSNKKFKFYIINTSTPTNKSLIKKFLSLFLIFYSIIKSIFILKKEKPDLIFGFGGYVSFPVSLVSKFFKLPLIIYENNVLPGRANKYLASFAKKILTAKEIKNNFSDIYKNKIYEVGSILSKDIINYHLKKEFNDNKEFSILVLGGSQGAEIFGNIVPNSIKMLKNEGYNIKIYQQCTSGQKQLVTDFYKKNNIENYIFEFAENIPEIISFSDLAISRCGASSTAELVYTLTPFIGVPLPNSVDNHQYLNAKYYEKKGCCWLLEQKDFDTNNLFNLIVEILKNKNKLKKVYENMKKNQDKNVYKSIENEIKDFL